MWSSAFPHFVGAIHESSVLRGGYLPRFGRFVKRPYDGRWSTANPIGSP